MKIVPDVFPLIKKNLYYMNKLIFVFIIRQINYSNLGKKNAISLHLIYLDFPHCTSFRSSSVYLFAVKVVFHIVTIEQ